MAKGIILQPQATDPISSVDNTAHGIWVNASGDLIQKKGTNPAVNVTASLESGVPAPGARSSLRNATGSTITKGTPVSINSNGELQLVDVSVEASAAAMVGVAESDISNNTDGNVITNGKIANITTSFGYGSVLYINKSGVLTNIKPSEGVNGFIAGDFIVNVGVIAKDPSSVNKDLIVNHYIVGQL